MPALQIESVKVEKLFGLYDYEFNKEIGQNPSGFMILYGDNGTGKTTILKILYHLFSSEVQRGHKSQLANIRFKSIVVRLVDGSIVEAYRVASNSGYLGDYSLRYRKGEKDISCKMTCKYDEERGLYYIPSSDPVSKAVSAYYSFLNIFKENNILYISDDRREDGYKRASIEGKNDKNKYGESEEIIKEMKALQEWIISQVLEETKKGEEGTSEIYSRILANFTKRPPESNEERSFERLQQALNELTQKADRLVNLGFIPNPDYNMVLSKIAQVDKKKEEVVYNILAPYLETQNKKMNALDNLADKVLFFTHSLNDYLYRKTAEYSVSEGLRVFPIENRAPISYSKLSSGEKQLILLFGKIIRASTMDSLIIIDEPEISLNIKWQRMLLDTMKYLVRGSNVQFVIATHSFEILSGHLQDTISLNDSAKFE